MEKSRIKRRERDIKPERAENKWRIHKVRKVGHWVSYSAHPDGRSTLEPSAWLRPLCKQSRWSGTVEKENCNKNVVSVKNSVNSISPPRSLMVRFYLWLHYNKGPEPRFHFESLAPSFVQENVAKLFCCRASKSRRQILVVLLWWGMSKELLSLKFSELFRQHF